MQDPDEETLGLYWGSLYESYYFGAIGPGFLNQVPTLPSGRVGGWGVGVGLARALVEFVFEFAALGFGLRLVKMHCTHVHLHIHIHAYIHAYIHAAYIHTLLSVFVFICLPPVLSAYLAPRAHTHRQLMRIQENYHAHDGTIKSGSRPIGASELNMAQQT